MEPLHLAIVWHHHQPYYPDDVADEVEMPWVRLHGSKDYWGMARHLEQHPDVHVTVNLVPSLLIQLIDYGEHGREDRLLSISRTPADSLSRDEALYLLEHGFFVNLDHMIRPVPRYYELWRLRGRQLDNPERALKRFRTQDLRDLQVWVNLVWIHRLALEDDPQLLELWRKQRYYTEEEKLWILERQLELVREVVPKYRRLMEAGQIELTTSPFFHPILPLLLNRRLAKVCDPETELTDYQGGYPEDAEWHVREGLDLAASLLGRRPVGLWPPEGAVCEEMVPLLAAHGIQWFATDEVILSRSLDGKVRRDPATGYVHNPELLYQPWAVEVQGQQVHAVFRDRALSDLIGFHYQKVDPHEAVRDFVSKLEAIRRAVPGPRPPLVTIVLDGENSWEHYPQGGLPFLRALYGELARHRGIKTCTVSEHLSQFPPEQKLTRLHPGSWVDGTFKIWIGHPEDRTAWNLLDQARRYLDEAAQAGRRPAALERAWREIYIAEGSDWFWWFGDEHPSAQIELFDYLFRKHLQNVYRLLGDPPPGELLQPIHTERRTPRYSQPTALLNVEIDGEPKFFEWTGAGIYVVNGLKRSQGRVYGLCAGLLFGFSKDALQLRIDLRGPATELLRAVDAIRVGFLVPAGLMVEFSKPSDPVPEIKVTWRGRPAPVDPGIRIGVGRVIEIALPTSLLGVAPGKVISFFVELFQGPTSVDRLPQEGTIETVVPREDFEAAMWLA